MHPTTAQEEEDPVDQALSNLLSCAFVSQSEQYSYSFVCEGHFYHVGLDRGETIQIESYDPKLKEFRQWVTHYPQDQIKALAKEKEFVLSPIFKVIQRHSIGGNSITQFGCSGYADLIIKVGTQIEKLFARGFTYIRRSKPQRDFANAIKKYKLSPEQYAALSKHETYGEELLPLDERTNMLILEDSPITPLITNLKQNQVVVTQNPKITQELISSYYREGYFIRDPRFTSSNGIVKDCIVVQADETISITNHPKFPNSAKASNFFTQTQGLPFCSNWLDITIDNLFKHKFVFLYKFDDSFKPDSLLQINKILKNNLSNTPTEFIYQT